MAADAPTVVFPTPPLPATMRTLDAARNSAVTDFEDYWALTLLTGTLVDGCRQPW